MRHLAQNSIIPRKLFLLVQADEAGQSTVKQTVEAAYRAKSGVVFKSEGRE
jgi:hypothetical protein